MKSEIQFRDATHEDLPDIVRLLSDDPLGREREADTSPLPNSYHSAFEAIDCDSNNQLVVVESMGGVIGMLQLTFIPYLTFRGSWRAVIEGVRIDQEFRSRGIGQKLISHAVELAKRRGCHLIQLTSDKRRPEAIRFYERQGFVSSHEGLKLNLGPGDESP
ncbi:MAG: GNAT family N-acetyltransferase [Verrucomicrobiales bacterium]|nr:GNAT family N-acetyltransferase [Verrucomicrobiales bacterium]